MSSSRPYSGSLRPTHALLSIRPEFVHAILRGEKRYEFRRRVFAHPVDVIVVYATMPVGMVIAEFDVQSIITESPRTLWERTHRFAGIDEERFFKYFAGVDRGHAIEIGDVRPYTSFPYSIDALGITPPQSFTYLHVCSRTAGRRSPRSSSMQENMGRL